MEDGADCWRHKTGARLAEETSHRMKKKLGALVRVVVSVGILAYLFHGIFKKEALDYFQTHNIDPDTLQWSERARIIWSVGPQVLWDAVRKVDALWLAAAVICAGLP